MLKVVALLSSIHGTNGDWRKIASLHWNLLDSCQNRMFSPYLVTVIDDNGSPNNANDDNAEPNQLSPPGLGLVPIIDSMDGDGRTKSLEQVPNIHMSVTRLNPRYKY